MLEPGSVDEISIPGVDVVTESAPTNNNGEFLDENRNTNGTIEEKEGDDKGDSTGCTVQERSSGVIEETENNGEIKEAVQESSAEQGERSEESSAITSEGYGTAAKPATDEGATARLAAAKEGIFQQPVHQQTYQLPLRHQPAQYQHMTLNQPIQYQQLPLRQPQLYQQSPLGQSIQHQNLSFSHPAQQRQLPVQYQQLPIRQPVQYQQLPVTQPAQHTQQHSRQVLREPSSQSQYHMPQSIHSEPEIRTETILGKRLPQPIHSPPGHDAPEHLSQEVLAAAAAMALAAPVYDTFDPMKMSVPMKHLGGDYLPTQHLQYTGGQYHGQHPSHGHLHPHGELKEAANAVPILPQDNQLQLCHNCHKEGITTYKLPRRWCNECRNRKRAKK